MDAVIAQLVASLSKSMTELSAARVDAAQTGAYLKYAELTGRIETMRVVISFFQQTAQAAVTQAEETPPTDKKEEEASQ